LSHVNGVLIPTPAPRQRCGRVPQPRPWPEWAQLTAILLCVLQFCSQITSGLNNRTVSNSYDSINRLLTEAVTGAAANVTTAYAYDSANNRTSKAVAGGTAAGATS
jgi:YD repeat-containing protein